MPAQELQQGQADPRTPKDHTQIARPFAGGLVRRAEYSVQNPLRAISQR